jgi:hypothetical protein
MYIKTSQTEIFHSMLYFAMWFYLIDIILQQIYICTFISKQYFILFYKLNKRKSFSRLDNDYTYTSVIKYM